jgi:predicted nucleotidyltransferase
MAFIAEEILNREKLSQFCRNNHIHKMSLFGSALRGELRPESDIDLLVEFKKNMFQV